MKVTLRYDNNEEREVEGFEFIIPGYPYIHAVAHNDWGRLSKGIQDDLWMLTNPETGFTLLPEPVKFNKLEEAVRFWFRYKEVTEEKYKSSLKEAFRNFPLSSASKENQVPVSSSDPS